MKCTLIGKGAVFLGAESSPVPWGGHILRCLSQGTWELSSSSSFPLALLYLHGVSLASACHFCLAAGGFIPLFPVLHDLSHKIRKSHKLSSSASPCLAQGQHPLEPPKPFPRGQERGMLSFPALLLLQCILGRDNREKMDPLGPAQLSVKSILERRAWQKGRRRKK